MNRSGVSNESRFDRSHWVDLDSESVSSSEYSPYPYSYPYEHNTSSESESYESYECISSSSSVSRESGYESLPLSSSDSDLTTSSYESDISLPSTASYSSHNITPSINMTKWWKGVNNFYKLNNRYSVYIAIVYLWPFMLLSNNVFIAHRFNQSELIWFWFILPFITTYLLYYTQDALLFAYTPTVSSSMLSHYPGKNYEYGLLIDRKYNRVDDVPTHEYWVVHNESTNDADLIVVKNQYYNEHTVCVYL